MSADLTVNLAELPQLVWLALLCSPPLVIALVCALRRRTIPEAGDIRIGNPMFTPGMLPAHREAEVHPLLHLARTRSDAGLRALIVGMRHLPLNDTAFILRRYQKSDDAELQLYSQCILREKQERLQSAFARLLPLAVLASPGMMASCIEAGLELATSPLTPGAERDSVLRKLLPVIEASRNPDVKHPRTLFAGARYCLLTRETRQAEELRDRLPTDSPLRETLAALVAHHAAIQNLQTPLAPRYMIR